jgi:phage virion morphogenesis protein
MQDLRIKFPGLDRFQQALMRVSKFRKSVLLDQLADLMLAQNRKRLDQEKESPDGEPWAPLSPEYAARKGGGEVLEESHSLLDSIQAQSGSDGVSLGSNLLYAAVHLYGDEARGIPARPYLGFSDDDLVELGEVAEDFLRGMFR